MSSPRPRLKSTRLFSMQLANHDMLFAPKVRRVGRFRWLKALLYVPAVLFLFMPSFKIGRAILKNPGLQIPDQMIAGEIFTLPADDEELIPQVNGRTLAYIDAKEPLYLGAAPRQRDFEVNFSFMDLDDRPKLRRFIERFKHPEYPIFVKKIHVIDSAEPAPVDAGKPGKKAAAPLIALIEDDELKAYDRRDGSVRMRCWKNPAVEPVGVDPLKPRRHPRIGLIGSAGSGEVTYAGVMGGGSVEEVVVVYHGGGLYTRYWGLKDAKVQKGMKITAGQTLGSVLLAPLKHETPPTWAPYFTTGGQPSEIRAPSLLALSSRLCETK